MSPPPVLLKLGGALLTRKQGSEALRPTVLQRLADEIAGWSGARPGRLVLGHGGGSFAHVAVAETGLLERPGDPLSLARVAAAAARLDRFVIAALLERDLPALPVPCSLLARCEAGVVDSVRAEMVEMLLASGLLPVVYGDAAPDRVQGAAIASTEPLLVGLAHFLGSARVILATDVDGVYDRDPHAGGARRFDRIDPADRAGLLAQLRGARAGVTDVTGGMLSKVSWMLDLAEAFPGLEIRIISGLRPGAVAAALAGDPDMGGTLIRAG